MAKVNTLQEKTLSEPKAKSQLSMPSSNASSGIFKQTEFLPELRGNRGLKVLREMRDNDPIIGASVYAVEQVLRDVELKVEPADDSELAKKEAEFLKTVMDDMEHSFDDHISESVSFLTMGFSWFEVVYKRRLGTKSRNSKKNSNYTDGRIGVSKIVSRAPWDINKFEVDKKTGKVLGVYQNSFSYGNGDNFIPSNKSLYYKTTSIDNDPTGRSILRNAYTSYNYLKGLQSIEAIAIEREMHGIPVGRIPAEYLMDTATDDQKALVDDLKKVLEGVKLNETGYILLPSDLYLDQDGKSTGGVAARLLDIELMTTGGSRSIDIAPVINRYQHDIARSMLSEFLMLGSGATGSYALSKSKTDLFLRALESYINTIADVLNKQLVEKIWELNGLPFETMPKIVAGDVAPHDLKELGSYLRNLNGANIDLSDEPKVINALLKNAELPEVDPNSIKDKADRKREVEDATIASKNKDDPKDKGKEVEDEDEE